MTTNKNWPPSDALTEAIAKSATGMHRIVGLANLPEGMTVDECKDYLRDKMCSILSRCFDGRTYKITSETIVGPVVDFAFPDDYDPNAMRQVTMTVVVTIADSLQAKVGDLCTVDLSGYEPHRNNGDRALHKWEFIQMKHGYLRTR